MGFIKSKARLYLYEKVPKSISFPNGVEKIEPNNFLLEQPIFLCVSAQDDPKSVFGITKYCMNVMGLHVRENNPNGYALEDFPASFCSIRLEKDNEGGAETKEDQLQLFYDDYLKDIVEENEQKIDTDELAKRFRMINLLGYCDGNERIGEIINCLKNNMGRVGYTDKEIDYAVSQIGLVTLATERNTSKFGCTVVDFHEYRDMEVSNQCIHQETQQAVIGTSKKEGYKRINDRRVEYLMDVEDAHEMKHYYYDGTATPAIFRKVLSNLLISSIKTADDEFEPLTVEQAMDGCDELLGEKGSKNREELLDMADSTIKFERKVEKDGETELVEARRVTPEEARSRDELDRVCDALVSTRKSEHSYKVRFDELEAKYKRVKELITRFCSKDTEDKIDLEMHDWQFTPEREKEINEAPSDRELIGKQANIIQSQNGTIRKLRTMLGRVLDFAETVRSSVFGKVFFGKRIKALPSSQELQDSVSGKEKTNDENEVEQGDKEK